MVVIKMDMMERLEFLASMQIVHHSPVVMTELYLRLSTLSTSPRSTSDLELFFLHIQNYLLSPRVDDEGETLCSRLYLSPLNPRQILHTSDVAFGFLFLMAPYRLHHFQYS
jgi:hypothetical protein